MDSLAGDYTTSAVRNNTNRSRVERLNELRKQVLCSNCGGSDFEFQVTLEPQRVEDKASPKAVAGPFAILKTRFAKGEISKEEYLEMKSILESY